MMEAILKVGFTDATPIQELVIPQVLRGKDVSGLAQTGTGKTAAFVIPLMDRLLRFRAGEEGERVPKNFKKNSFILVLVPTRELAVQVEEAVASFGKAYNMRSCVIVGGSGYDDQRKALRDGVEFVVGTPGRLLDLYKTHDLNLNNVGAIVFDEADRMFDMGFKDDMKYILRRVPRDRQFLLFSATLNFDVLNTAYQFGAEPVEFNVSRDSATAEGIDHEILNVGQDEKPMFLLSVLKKVDPSQCIVFSNFKHNVRPIARFLKDNGIEAIEMSSLLSQAQRNKVIESFKSGKKQILVATDVAARGLDVKGIDLVVNFDLPDDPEGYVHRIGRTGRAGGSGRAVGLVSDRDVEALVRIENYLKEKLKIGWMEETDLVKEFKPYVKEFIRDAGGPPGRRGPPRPGFQGRSGGPARGGGRSGGGSSGPGRPSGGERRPAPAAPKPHAAPAASGPTSVTPPAAPAPRAPSGHGRRPRPSPQQNPQQGRPGNTPTNQPAQPHGRQPGQQQGPTSTPPPHGQTAANGPSATSHQHRDRRLGRHGGGVAGAATGGTASNKPGRKSSTRQ